MDNFRISLIWIIIYTLSGRVNAGNFNVMHYGAVGNGRTDDSQAFLKAWNTTCGSTGDSTMIIPRGRTFLVNPVSFNGPCNSSSITVRIAGAIIAPDDPITWKGLQNRLYLKFQKVNNLTLSGSGSINGRGYKWWDQSCKHQQRPGCIAWAPPLLSFYSCSDLVLRDLKLIDSPQFHIAIFGSEGVNIKNLNIRAPETSPNTDGIHIQDSHHVNIRRTAIGTGDDCISIGDKTSEVNISTVVCGPGHGISIGSLGRGGESDVLVEKIRVEHSKFIGTDNGARIKTWQGANGLVDQITFQQLYFINVKNPIIIDQYYCDQVKKCTTQPAGVKISNVSYISMNGTSATPVAINLKCDETVGCTGIILQDVNITSAVQGKEVSSYCINSHGSTVGLVRPLIPCLSKF